MPLQGQRSVRVMLFFSYLKRLAIDIGAVSVRGNHDHEVIRQGIAFSKKTGKYQLPSERRAAVKSNVSRIIIFTVNAFI